MLALARDYAKVELCHIYPPHKKQFIRGVREVRRAARGHAAAKEHELIWSLSFNNILFKSQMAQETAQVYLFGTKEAIKHLR